VVAVGGVGNAVDVWAAFSTPSIAREHPASPYLARWGCLELIKPEKTGCSSRLSSTASKSIPRPGESASLKCGPLGLRNDKTIEYLGGGRHRGLHRVGHDCFVVLLSRVSKLAFDLSDNRQPRRTRPVGLAASRAIVLLTGTLSGGPEGSYGFETSCHDHRVFVAVEMCPFTLASPSCRNILRRLSNADWRRADTTMPVTMIARVSSEILSCFGPGVVVTALAVRTSGPIKVTPHKLTQSVAVRRGSRVLPSSALAKGPS
jgi:hypothetical protein